MKTGIYKIQSVVMPQRIYIGSSVNIIKRKIRHFNELRDNKHGNLKLQRHFNKYGEKDFKFSIEILCAKEELIKIEQQYIDLLNPYFNLNKIAGSCLGRHWTLSLETRQNISKNNGMRGKKHTLESREKMRLNRKSKPQGMKGKHHSEETKQKIREKRKLQFDSIETRMKRRKPKPVDFGQKIKDNWVLRRLKKIA